MRPRGGLGLDRFRLFVHPRRYSGHGTVGPLRRPKAAEYSQPMIHLSRGRAGLLVAVLGLVLLGASPPPSPMVRCDIEDATTCATYVQLALELASGQGLPVASAELVRAEPTQATVGPLGDVQIIMHARSGADLGVV